MTKERGETTDKIKMVSTNRAGTKIRVIFAPAMYIQVIWLSTLFFSVLVISWSWVIVLQLCNLIMHLIFYLSAIENIHSYQKQNTASLNCLVWDFRTRKLPHHDGFWGQVRSKKAFALKWKFKFCNQPVQTIWKFLWYSLYLRYNKH